MSVPTAKTEIRRTLRARRAAVSSDDRLAVSREISRRLLERCEFAAAIAARRPIAVYLASPVEIDISDFILTALSRGAALVAPRWNGTCYDLTMLRGLSPADLAVGPHGILEPRLQSDGMIVSPDRVAAWVIPGLAFTTSGKRLGYGGGWYDRFLVAADPAAARVGVAYAFQIVNDLPTEPHDVLLTDVLAV